MRNEISIARLPEIGSQNCQAQLFARFEELERAGEVKPDAVVDAWVRHEAWCCVHRGKACVCDPCVEIFARKNRA